MQGPDEYAVMPDLDLLEHIDDDGADLTRWEIDFVADNLEIVRNGGELRGNRREKAEQIAEERIG